MSLRLPGKERKWESFQEANVTRFSTACLDESESYTVCEAFISLSNGLRKLKAFSNRFNLSVRLKCLLCRTGIAYDVCDYCDYYFY